MALALKPFDPEKCLACSGLAQGRPPSPSADPEPNRDKPEIRDPRAPLERPRKFGSRPRARSDRMA